MLTNWFDWLAKNDTDGEHHKITSIRNLSLRLPENDKHNIPPKNNLILNDCWKTDLDNKHRRLTEMRHLKDLK